ncbi:protein yippee-like 1 [Lepeophtheirus salmonis]|uniref:Putative LOC100116973 [Nasonia vitripennis] n=1 Tax=Lepeophtheirus salmonis TaxID=72036 RepID=A0A0K2T3F6_LEPSM|nr:protein yippee-like 1 [Lepeophtheirus salmonis]
MPCNFISSCFLLDHQYWDRHCIAGSEEAGLRGVSNQARTVANQPGSVNGGGGGRVGGSGSNSSSASSGNGSNPSSASSVVPESTTKIMKTFRAYLPPACHRTYSCVHCRAHLANHDELISKSFQGSQGRAYLFNSVVNIGCGAAEERVLLTGLHAVADIYCDCCKTTLGWKYEQAYESSQKYKEGKFIIELAHMIKENGWES